MKDRNYFVYITTNPNKTVLYTGFTNNLEQRLTEHFLNRGSSKIFAGKYYCYNLVYYERHSLVLQAQDREKEIKGWRREKKLNLINEFNPEFNFLNHEIMEWPPEEGVEARG
ncbi:GIY-YIG nuclease family protein [Bacteroidota bacterium]